jgi:SPP1 gp7 family putative phage head morphogenesis protein
MNVFQIIRRFRQWLYDGEARAQTEVLRAYEVAWKAIAEELAKVTSQAGASSEEVTPRSFAPEQMRLRELERQIVKEIRKVGRVASNVTMREQERLVKAAERQSARLIESKLNTGSAVEVGATFNKLPADVINNLVGAASDGSPVRESFDRLAGDLGLATGERVKTALVQGAALGMNPTEIARHVRREVDAKGDNQMRQPAVVRRLNQTVRTESYRALREATRASYEASGVTELWRWVSALSPTTCVVCWAMHGKMFPLDVPLESHIACRCVMVPVLDPNEPFETGPERFAKLEHGFQKQVLGETAFEAYQDGRVKLEDLVGIRASERWGRSRYRRSLKEINGGLDTSLRSLSGQ